MFAVPRLEQGQSFPELPFDDPEWPKLLCSLGVPWDFPYEGDPLLYLMKYAIGWVERLEGFVKPWHLEPALHSSKTSTLRRLGLIDGIHTVDGNYDYVLVDGGGSSERFHIRLGYAQSLQELGLLKTNKVVVLAGQGLRLPHRDSFDMLSVAAIRLRGRVDSWANSWLEDELSLSDEHLDRWQRPFATERDVIMLRLLTFNSNLGHIYSRLRANPVSVHPTIPPLAVAADDFDLGGQRITVLNAPAKIREHAGRKMPLSYARSTGRSCFYEWLLLDNPRPGSSVLLITHAPNIYRSWFDMVLRAAQAGRQDLHITAAGPGVKPHQTVGDVLEGFGNLIINFYNLKYEGGIESPGLAPFKMGCVR